MKKPHLARMLDEAVHTATLTGLEPATSAVVALEHPVEEAGRTLLTLVHEKLEPA